MGWRKLFFPRKVDTRREPAPVPAESKAEQAPQPSRLRLSAGFHLRLSHDEPFVEHAVTLNVSASGGLLSLSREVVPSQELLIANLQTDEELPCRVARVTKTQAGTVLVGFEFLRSRPAFLVHRIQIVMPREPASPHGCDLTTTSRRKKLSLSPRHPNTAPSLPAHAQTRRAAAPAIPNIFSQRQLPATRSSWFPRASKETR